MEKGNPSCHNEDRWVLIEIFVKDVFENKAGSVCHALGLSITKKCVVCNGRVILR